MQNNYKREGLGRSPILWLVSAALAVIFTALQIQSSLHSGALSLPATYDDVGYFIDALRRLEVLYRYGALAMLKNFVVAPPHAPLSTILAMLGFGLIGRYPWAADAMNALPLMLLLRIMLGYASRVQSLRVALPLVAAFLGFPILGLVVLEFRPDMLCALFAASGAIVIVADPRWRAGDRSAWLLSTALFVGAMLTKPTLAPVTIFVFGVAMTVSVALHASSRKEARRIAGVALISGGIGTLIVLPYYILAFAHIYSYIKINVFGSQANVWAKTFPLKDHLLYYLTGPGGATAIGSAWLVLAVLLVLAALPSLRRVRATAFGVAVVGLAAFASVTAPAMKSPFIGLIVPALVLVTSFAAALMFLSRLQRPWAMVTVYSLLVLSVATWRPISLRLWNTTVPIAQSRDYQRIHRETVDALALVPQMGRLTLYFPLIAQYLNNENIEFELLRRGLEAPRSHMVYLNGDFDYQYGQLARAELVILFSEDSTLPLTWPATTAIRKRLFDAVMASGSFETIAEIAGGANYPGKVIVMKRKQPEGPK